MQNASKHSWTQMSGVNVSSYFWKLFLYLNLLIIGKLVISINHPLSHSNKQID